MNVEIKNRFTGAVMFAAEIACDKNTPFSLRLGLAVKAAVADGARLDRASLVGARLDGARLDGARLDGARLDGASLDGASLDRASLDGASLDGALIGPYKLKKFVASVSRLDGYVFLGFTTDKGLLIRAGCRTFTTKEYRAHVKANYAKEPKGEETLAILDFIEDRAEALARREKKAAS